MKFFRSLLVKYMLIILLAIFIVQISYLAIALFVFGFGQTGISNEVLIESEMEQKWHTEAKSIKNFTDEGITQHFKDWQKRYPKSSMF